MSASESTTRPAPTGLPSVEETLAQFGGKGGGQPAMAQGALTDPSQADAAVKWAGGQLVERWNASGG